MAAYGVMRSRDSSFEGRRRESSLAQRLNVDAALALFRHAQKTGSNSFVQAGTCFEYAPLTGGRDNLDSVIYGVSKARTTEARLRSAPSSTLSLVIARIFNVYGPGEKGERLLPSLVQNLSHCRRVPISVGLHIKDYLHVDGVVEGLCVLALTTRDPEISGGAQFKFWLPRKRRPVLARGCAHDSRLRASIVLRRKAGASGRGPGSHRINSSAGCF
ncbi:NAD-dependent epimerase/dehydratase family protein [Bradyrhizobium sp. 169]|nr:NAD-dependent epimerase/dehydratase family protein [Bradyrhizobium sp. 169]